MKEVLEELDSIKFKVKLPGLKEGDNTRTTIIGGEGSETPVQSTTLGLVLDYRTSNLVPSTATRQNKFKRLHLLLKKLIKQKDPNFKYTSITINKNLKTHWHRDKKNVGSAYSLTLGNFRGGFLEVERDNGSRYKVDTHNRMTLIDNMNLLHRTGNWRGGDRYNIVWYKKRNQAS